jgi:hypothetical protein
MDQRFQRANLLTFQRSPDPRALSTAHRRLTTDHLFTDSRPLPQNVVTC